MTGKIRKGASFAGLARYLFGPGKREEHVDPRVVASDNVLLGDPRTWRDWVADMTFYAQARPDVARPVWHCSLRAAPEDPVLGDARWAAIAEQHIEAMGLAGHPWVAVRHGPDDGGGYAQHDGQALSEVGFHRLHNAVGLRPGRRSRRRPLTSISTGALMPRGLRSQKEVSMSRKLNAVFSVLALGVTTLAVADGARAQTSSGWPSAVPVTNTVANTPFRGGGYSGYEGAATAPTPGSCGEGNYNSNLSESWLALQPGTENLVGTSKVFFDKYSTYYNFHLGSHRIAGGAPAGSNIVQQYECVTTGTQEMPPSWMNNTDPNAAFDTKGRVYQVTLPFNPFWANLHPNSHIEISYSDDLGQHWVKGNGGQPLEHEPNWSSRSLGFVEDKQWVAVNHFPGNRYQDHVYAAWAVYNGQTTKIIFAASADRGQTFRRALTVSRPNETGATNEYVYPVVDPSGDVYLVYAANSPSNPGLKTIYVSRSTDDGVTWGTWYPVATTPVLTSCCLPNTTFRDGILEHFAASEDHPGHLYMVWEQWDGTQFDVYFSQSVDSGRSWSERVKVNDNVEGSVPTDQFQPSVAAGPGGAVAVAFYDRRRDCPNDKAILPEHVGRTNFCIDTSLQVFTDHGGGAVKVGGNARFSTYTWDPEQPAQTIDGLDQMACASHENPCVRRAFIGDYFGLAISGTTVYGLFVSTHYPSDVVGDQGTRIYYQQQILAKASRTALGV